MARAKSENQGQDNAPALTDMQRRFVVEYASCLNATKAAKKAGYSENTAREQGHRLLTNVHIREEVDKLLAEHIMSPMEVLVRFGQQARAEHSRFWKCDFGEKVYIDMVALIEAGLGHLIKSVTKDAATGYITKVEFHDSQAALRDLGKYHKLFTDKTEVSGANGDPVRVLVEYVKNNSSSAS